MTAELAEQIISLEKYVVHEGNNLDLHTIHLDYPIDFRLGLSAPDDLDLNLMVNIKESLKKALKISLHHQDNSTHNGLLRIDYYSRHFNPVDVNEEVPDRFKPFAGLWLDDYAGHIHYVVNGYKPLAWAIPLEMDNFPVKELAGREDYLKTLKAFFKKINVKTVITYNQQLTIV